MPEDKSTSAPDASHGDAASETSTAPKRIAIRARDAEIGEALWQTIERSAKKSDAAVQRAPREQADIVVYALSAADLAELRAIAAEVMRDRAPTKFLLEPAGDAKMRERTAPSMSELGRLTGAIILGAEDSAISYSVEDTLQKQAKAIARTFRGEGKPQKPAKPERKDKKVAKKRDKKADKKVERKSSRRGEAPAKERKRKPGKKGKAGRAAKELEETAARRAEKKSAKRAAKQERKSGKKVPLDDAARAEKKAAKRAAKVAPDTAAKRAEKKSAKRAAKLERKSAKKAPLDEAARAEKKAAKKAAKAQTSGAALVPADTAREEKKAGKRAAKEERKANKQPKGEAARAEKKAAKRAAKEERKAGEVPADAARAEKKAAKRAAKKERKADKADKGEKEPLDAAARAEKKAAKRAAKEERKADKADKGEKEPLDAAARAEKKAAKRAAKEERKGDKQPKDEAARSEKKAAKKERKADKAGKNEKDALDDAARAEKKAAKKAAKIEKRKSEKAALTPEEKAAKRAAKKAARSEPQIGPDGEIVDETKPLRLMLANETLRPVLEAALHDAGVEVEGPKKETKADLVVYTFDDPPEGPDAIAAHAAALKNVKARLRIFVERAVGDDLDESNRAIARLAGASGGAVLRLNAKFRRFGAEHLLADGRPNAEGLKLVAEGIVGAAAGRLPRREFKLRPQAVPPDLAEARALAADPNGLLGQIKWSGAPPKSLSASLSPEQTEALADSKLLLTDELAVPFRLPFDWEMELEDHKAEKNLLSLDFLIGPLTYWYFRANGNASERIGQIDAALKQRGSSPNAILMRATQIIADFIAKNPRDTAPDAWSEHAVGVRARVMMLFLLCCKAALKRKITFSASTCASAYLHLLDLVEMLRGDGFYAPCAVEGVQQDCLTIGLALGLRGTPYGNALLAQSLERFKTLQLDLGLTSDGVWFTDSYSMHCAVLSSLSGVLGDFPVAEQAQSAPFAAVAKKMTAFAEAMLKSNGAPPAIDDSRQKSYAEKLSGQRRTIAKAATGTKAAKVPLVKRIIDTYVFRDAQYFISHSSQKVEADSSLVVLHADPPSVARNDPGGIVLVFAHGERDLLVRAKLAEKIRGRQDRTPLYDPQLRNGYRVNGAGNLPPEPGDTKAARLVKSWRGDGWAAAKSIEDTYADASVARVAIHLKALHALIVVDELSAGAQFEQFWNPGPDLAVPESEAAPLRFTAETGALEMAFAPEAPTAIDRGETCAAVHRRPEPGVTASIFQWTDGSAAPGVAGGPAPLSVALERAEPGNWAIRAEGRGFTARVALAGTDLTCELEPKPIS